MGDERKDVWAAGKLYEPYVGRWSRLVALEFLAWLAVPPQRDWLDVGCGTGALTETILRQVQPRSESTSRRTIVLTMRPPRIDLAAPSMRLRAFSSAAMASL